MRLRPLRMHGPHSRAMCRIKKNAPRPRPFCNTKDQIVVFLRAFSCLAPIRKPFNRRERKERRRQRHCVFAFYAFFAVKSISIRLRLRRSVLIVISHAWLVGCSIGSTRDSARPVQPETQQDSPKQWQVTRSSATDLAVRLNHQPGRTPAQIASSRKPIHAFNSLKPRHEIRSHAKLFGRDPCRTH